MKKFLSLVFVAAVEVFLISAQSHNSKQSHNDAVTAICPVQSSSGFDQNFFSTGEDGFIIKWSQDGQGEHYQICEVGIKLLAVSPDGNLVAAYESDGGSVNKVSVWDWTTLTRKYQRKFSDSITSLSFSSKGTYLIIGTATMDGALFVKTQGWQIVNKLKSKTSIVNYVNTSDTEKSVAFYSPTGSISYYNLLTGVLKQKIKVMNGLEQVVMFNNNIFLAGVKDNYIHIVNAFQGTSVASIPASNPIILSTTKDSNLYYLEYDGKNSYELKMLENQENLKVSNPRIVKTYKGPRGSNAISTGTKHGASIYLGSKSGAMYMTDSDPSITSQNLIEYTSNPYTKILSMAPAPQNFYMLTESTIYNSSYDSGEIKTLANVSGFTNIEAYDSSSVVLWSKNTRNPVCLLNLQTKEQKTLFTPANNIQILRIQNINGKNYIIDIESSTSVNVFDMEKSQLKNVYSGLGIQDAVLVNNGNLYVAKSASSNPQVPLVCIDLTTLETVPIRLGGNVAYALSTDGAIIYGINLVSDENGKTTFVFSYNTLTGTITNILKFSSEDSEAFTTLYGKQLFTNIGKNKVYCYDLSTKKRFAYNRSASMPQTICKNGNRVAILNYDGSISWAEPSSQNLTADWYLTTDGQWFEY